MEIIKFNDFMSGNYSQSKYETVLDAVVARTFKAIIFMGVAIFGMIFFEQFMQMMQATDVFVFRPIGGV
ncbi:hypothetical protein PQE66_gp233 [Bacillus phage PBC2]|uniref:Uncharacterized protein n=1 Tax=Bacillus phage PBC2 TaxID=1675029 RepID=A0A218KCE6_9CAUD|nr:hypothetical protein PQE66_gp233 [Bacillus phage PBC2]AKQ08563.1 hypothetical protein PBC2_248 [Bacillus phage PBC2]